MQFDIRNSTQMNFLCKSLLLEKQIALQCGVTSVKCVWLLSAYHSEQGTFIPLEGV